MENFYYKKDILEKFHITNLTLYNWVKNGEFPKPAKMGGRSVWFESVIDKYLESVKAQQQEGTAISNKKLVE